MNNYLPKTTFTTRTILLVGAIAFLIYVYAVANGLTLPWKGKKEETKAVAYATEKKTLTPTRTPTPTPTSAPPVSNSTSTNNRANPSSNVTAEKNPSTAGSSAAPTISNQKVHANIPVSLPNVKVPNSEAVHIEIPKQISLPQILDTKINVKIDIPLL